MRATPIVHGHHSVELRDAPIDPDWITGGTPRARNAVLSTSADRMSTTLVWDCTPGRFRWLYDTDETIHVIEGSIVVDDGMAPARRLGPGDVVFFPAGAVVDWVVETHVRKLAFFRRPVPAPIGIALRILRKAMSLTRSVRQSMGQRVPMDPAPNA